MHQSPLLSCRNVVIMRYLQPPQRRLRHCLTAQMPTASALSSSSASILCSWDSASLRILRIFLVFGRFFGLFRCFFGIFNDFYDIPTISTPVALHYLPLVQAFGIQVLAKSFCAYLIHSQLVIWLVLKLSFQSNRQTN